MLLGEGPSPGGRDCGGCPTKGGLRSLTFPAAPVSPLLRFPLKLSKLRGHNAPLKAESPRFCDTAEPSCHLAPRGAPSARCKGNPQPWVGRGGPARPAPHKGALFPNQKGLNTKRREERAGRRGQLQSGAPWRTPCTRPAAPAGKGRGSLLLRSPGSPAVGGREGPSGVLQGARQQHPGDPGPRCRWGSPRQPAPASCQHTSHTSQGDPSNARAAPARAPHL